MAEVVGLVASIVQIAGAGCQLSSALYNYTTSAVRADQDIADIAGDVELTSNALESVGKVFESEEAKSVVSKKAIQDANNLIKRCDAVFKDISELVDKRRKVSKDGKKGLTVMGKLSWPMKEQRLELHRRRLDSLKNSLVLLLHVLQLAQGQARGQLEKDALEIEREKIRELHQRQQDSLKCLQALETKLSKVALDDEETLQGSAPPSRVPTLELMFGDPSATALGVKSVDDEGPQSDILKIDLSVPDSDTSESDAATTDDDEGEHLSLEDLEKASKHVQKLLKRITVLQKSFDGGHKTRVHKKKHVHKMYARFRKSWETHLGPISIATLPTQTPLSAPVLAPLPAPPLASYDHHIFASKTGGLTGRGGYDTDNLTFSQGLESSRDGYNSYSPAPYRPTPVIDSRPDTIISSANAPQLSGMRSQTQAAPSNPDHENVRAANGPPSHADTLIYIQPPNPHFTALFPPTNISFNVPNVFSESASDQQGGTATPEHLKEARNQQLKRDTSFPDLKMGQTDFKARTSPKQEIKKRMAEPGTAQYLVEFNIRRMQMARDRQIAQRSAQTQVQIQAQQQVQAQQQAQTQQQAPAQQQAQVQNSVQMAQQRAQPDTTSPSSLQGSAGSPKSYEQESHSNMSDDAQLRKTRSRIAQRNYRKTLKKRLEDLHHCAASGSASPEHKPAELHSPQLPPRYESSNMIGLEPVHPYPSAEDRMFSYQYTRQLSTSPIPVTQQAHPEISPHGDEHSLSHIEDLVAANMPIAHGSQAPSAADWNEPWPQQRTNSNFQSGHTYRVEHSSHQPYHDNRQGNHALQDYNMQLMLLEQQNRKRLLMARQEQDGLVLAKKKGKGAAIDRDTDRMTPGYTLAAPASAQADSQSMERGTRILSQSKNVDQVLGQSTMSGLRDQVRGQSAMSEMLWQRGQSKPVPLDNFAPRDQQEAAEFDRDISSQAPDMGFSDHAFDLSFGLDEDAALENFDFDSFLQSDQTGDSMWFGKDFDFSNVAPTGKDEEKAQDNATEGDKDMVDMGDARSPVQSISSFRGEFQFSEHAGPASPGGGWVPYQRKPRIITTSGESTTWRMRGRSKKLTAEQRSNATALRVTGSCQNCKIMKAACDAATPCRMCLRRRKRNPNLAPCRGRPWSEVTPGPEDTPKFAGRGPSDATPILDIYKQQTGLVFSGNSNTVHPALEYQDANPGPATWPTSDSLARPRSTSSHSSLNATKHPTLIENKAEFYNDSDDEDYKNSLGTRTQPGSKRRRSISDYPNPNAAPAIAMGTDEDMLEGMDEKNSESAIPISAAVKLGTHTLAVPDQVANEDGDGNIIVPAGTASSAKSPIVQDGSPVTSIPADGDERTSATSVPPIDVSAFVARTAPQGKKKRARGPLPPPEVLGRGIMSPTAPPAPTLSYPPPLPPIESCASLSTFDESGLKFDATQRLHSSGSFGAILLPFESRDDGEDDSIWPDSDPSSVNGTEICERLHQPVRGLKRKRMASEAASGNKRMKISRPRSASTRSSSTAKESSPPQSGSRDIVDLLLEEWTVLVG